MGQLCALDARRVALVAVVAGGEVADSTDPTGLVGDREVGACTAGAVGWSAEAAGTVHVAKVALVVRASEHVDTVALGAGNSIIHQGHSALALVTDARPL